MQKELAAEGLVVPVRILGINAVGAEANNDVICDGRDIPWLQDTTGEQVWQSWNATYRDVVILNPQNERVAVYNLTTHDLASPADYDALKSMLRDLTSSR
jgi:hypothetical protein